MARTVTETKLCISCGADVRPETQFCYNCGKQVAGAVPVNAVAGMDGETNESLAALEKALAESRPEKDESSKLESAAAERRRARGSQRKPIEIVWEATGPNIAYFIVAAAVLIMVAVVVFLTRTTR
jgi:hypothetical protein